MKKAVKIVLYGLLVVFVLVLLVAGTTQTQLFRTWLRNTALSALDSLLDADVQLGTLTGNLVTGFSLHDISIKVDGEEFVGIERLDIRYNIFEVPGKRISVDNLTLVHPRVNFICGSDGRWNFTRMIRPGPEDTTTAGAFDWIIAVKSLEFQDGIITLIDSAALAEEDHPPVDNVHAEFHQFSLRGVNLQTSALFSAEEKNASIKALSFTSNRPDIRLEKLSGEFHISRNETTVRDLVINTGRSRIQLDVGAEEIDLLAGITLEHLQHTPVNLKMRLQDIDLVELGWMVPDVDFLRGMVGLELEAEGEFGGLTVKKLDVKTGGSSMYLTGEVFNLHTPSELLLKVYITESVLSTADARRLLSTINIPDYDDLGPATLNLEFEGKPLDFASKFFIETSAGNIKSDLSLSIGGPESLTYDGEFLLQQVDLDRVFYDPSLNGSLNGIVKIKGSGVTLHDMTTRLEVGIDSSVFIGQPLSRSTLSLDVVDGNITGVVDVALGSMRSNLSVSLVDINSPSGAFLVEGEVASLNLEDILRDRKYNSDLTMKISSRGEGLSLKTLSGEFSLDIVSSRFGDYRIEEDSISLFLDQRDAEHKQIRLESNIADIAMNGAFDLEYFGQLIAYEVENISLAVGEKFAAVDTSLAGRVDRKKLNALGQRLAAAKQRLDMSYVVQIKDLEPLSRVTGDRYFNGTGTLRGAVLGNYDNLSLEGRLQIREFFYGNADSGVLLQNLQTSFQVTDLKPVHPLKELELWILNDANKMHINRTQFDSVEVQFRFSQEYSSYGVKTYYDNDLRVGVQGIASVSSDEMLFTFNTMYLAFKDFAWIADGGATIGFNSQGMHVDNLIMRRDTQEVTLSGSIATDGAMGATLRGSRLNLNSLQYLLSTEELSAGAESFSGIADVEVTATGTLAAPEYQASVVVDRFAFRTVPFGRITGDLRYLHGGLQTQVEVNNDLRTGTERPDLVINGVIPIDLGIGSALKADDLPALALDIRSDGVQMSILDPLVPTFNRLSGILRCNMRLDGSLQDPHITGSLAIDSCSFLFVPNNIFYTFEGKFEPAGERINVINAVVRNVAADRRLGRDGVMNIAGSFSLRELKPGDFDLTAIGKLLVVKETTRKSELSVYGNLFIETDAAGLRFTGSIEQSLLKGYVLIRNSSLVFPPTVGTAAREAERAIPVVFVDDTTSIDKEVDHSAVSLYFATASESGNDQTIVPRYLPTKSFLDGLRYDLDIESRGGNTEIRMIFNPATGEELVANMEGKFSMLDDGTQWVGTVTVDRAYYNFTKRFDAEGTIRFSGDFLNPELDITAKYRGTRTIEDSLGRKSEVVVVVLKITGFRFEPKLEISMTIDGDDYYSYIGPKSSDVNSDAIQFLITGSFPLSESQKNDIARDIRQTVGTSLATGATSLLSSTLSEFLRRETGFINSIELGYGSGASFGESADIRISGVVGDGLWRIGGRVLSDPFNNANVSIMYSLGDIFRSQSLRNFMFELERRIETSIGQINDRKEINSARLFYRFSFN